MKLLVTGNSLAATLCDSWPARAADHPELAASFFLAPHRIFMGLEVAADGRFGLSEKNRDNRQGRRWLERLNGSLSIGLTEYDAIVVIGPHFGIGAMLRTMDRYRVDEIRTSHSGTRRMSREAFCALHDDVIAQELDHLSSFPISRTIVIPGNRPAEGIGGDEGVVSEIWAPIDAAGANYGPTIDFLYARVAEAIAERGMTPLLQPAETLAVNGLTFAEFAKGPWLESGGDDQTQKRDHAHLTPAYGARLWPVILAEISRRQGEIDDGQPR